MIFTAKKLKNIENRPGSWQSQLIEVFQQETAESAPVRIGEFTRNYSSYIPFAPFRIGDRYFALYSSDYTSTRLLEFFPAEQRMQDIGGEDRNSNGFCPVQLYVPEVTDYFFQDMHSGPDKPIKNWEAPLESLPPNTVILEHGTTGTSEHYHVGYPPIHGFVAGCHWGDDSSWKIQHFDLSRATEGIITRDNRFGYIELPRNLTLEKAIDAEYLSESGRIRIAVEFEFDPVSGGMVDFSDFRATIEKGKHLLR